MTQPAEWNLQEETHVLENFRFDSGQRLDALRLRYLTLGTPERDASGAVTNAVLLLHNTTGSADIWLRPTLGGELFGSGQPLDTSKYFLIVPDCIGFGGSSKPSDGLRARFPNYRYTDMVRANHRLVTEALGIDHLRLALGISMGGMLTWMMAGTYPDWMDAAVPVACQPGPISGRNWIQRRVSIEAIRNDPEWNGGDYETNPSRYVFTAPFSGLLTQSVVRIQERAATREAGDAYYRELVERAQAGDANNRLYQVEASMDYDPSADLHKIKAKLLAINFADDELNPPALGVMEPAIAKIPGARYELIPAGPDSNGHLTSVLAKLWKAPLREFLAAAGI
jgi:homoserine O-acetyltransferase